MGRIPDSFVQEYKAKVSGAKVFGIGIAGLSTDELLATIGYLSEGPIIGIPEHLDRLYESLSKPAPAAEFEETPEGTIREIPRWRTEDIDEHVSAKMAGYEAALGLMEELVSTLRDGVRRLEAENERLKWRLLNRPAHLMRPQVFSFLGFHMESADVD